MIDMFQNNLEEKIASADEVAKFLQNGGEINMCGVKAW